MGKYTNNKCVFNNITLAASFAALLIIMVFSATMGAANIPFHITSKILLSKIPLIGYFVSLEGIDNTYVSIILNLRLPRIILSCLVGASLAVVGAALQGLLKNPMVDPYVLGISSGSSFGATIAIILGFEYNFFGIGVITFFSFIGAILTLFFVYNIAKTGIKISTPTLLLAGIAISFLLSSFVSIMMIFNRKQIEKIVFWIMGSVSAASWNQILIFFPFVIISIFIILLYSKELNIICTGEETAKSLGIDVERVKKILLTVCSLLVAGSVSLTGVIGFVGLVIPHIIRLLAGSNHKILLPYTAIGGAIFMVICDLIARNAAPPVEIPVGAITSVIGAPYFLFLLYKSKRKVL